METFSRKNAQEFVCSICDYNTMRNADLMRHFKTKKHKWKLLETFGNQTDRSKSSSSVKTTNVKCSHSNSSLKNLKIKNAQNTRKNAQDVNQSEFICNICYKSFNSKSGLWKHNKKCQAKDKELQQHLEQQLQQQQAQQIIELQQKQIEALKKQNNTINNNTFNNNTINNNTINVSIYLNENCKDALNISDFVEQLKVGLSELNTIRQLGYVKGVSNLLLKELGDLDIEKRPVFCNDPSKNTIYIKDAGIWEQDTVDNRTFKTAIGSVSAKCVEGAQNIGNENLNSYLNEEKSSTLYTDLLLSTLPISDESRDKEVKKIIQTVSDGIYREKIEPNN